MLSVHHVITIYPNLGVISYYLSYYHLRGLVISLEARVLTHKDTTTFLPSYP